MTAQSVRLPVLNSLLWIRDPTIEERPDIDGKSSVWSTPACVAVSCLPDCDGDTEVTIGTAQEVGLDSIPLFDGGLNTPSQQIIVETVLKESVLQMRVRSAETRVRIWTDGHQGTEFVVIGVD
ncbi:MAG: hypothetical protein ACRECX_14850 [Methyloceanibacter sp.]|uniref:hypothetical protein n=1 Tax=Methyloceanibacter sp. TaxID=1965321 RepID=UPI003D6CACD3